MNQTQPQKPDQCVKYLLGLKCKGSARLDILEDERGHYKLRKTPRFHPGFLNRSGFFRLFGLFLPRFPLFVLCLEAVLPASGHTSAL